MQHPKYKVVVFGETGVGKSALINGLAGEERTASSSDRERVTQTFQEVSVQFPTDPGVVVPECSVTFVDTPGWKRNGSDLRELATNVAEKVGAINCVVVVGACSGRWPNFDLLKSVFGSGDKERLLARSMFVFTHGGDYPPGDSYKTLEQWHAAFRTEILATLQNDFSTVQNPPIFITDLHHTWQHRSRDLADLTSALLKICQNHPVPISLVDSSRSCVVQ